MKPHTLIVLNGTLDSNLQETWTCTLRVLSGSPGSAFAPLDDSLIDTYLSQIATPVSTWFSTATTGIPATVKLVEIKANNIDEFGKYEQLNTHYYTYPVPVSGGGSSSPGLDIINSIVYSWRTSTASRGPASKGRMYPPNFGYVHASGTGKITDTVRTTAWQAADAFLDAIRNQGNPTTQVAPVLIATTGGSGWNYIDRIEVDNIIDVQRRRKNQLTSSRLVGVWP